VTTIMIHSNERLHKFGLIDSPRCNNCNEQIESINHKLIECPAAKLIWTKIKALKDSLLMEMELPVTMEGALGLDNKDKISLAINAEVLTKIISQGGKKYSSQQLAVSAIKTIAAFEPLSIDLRDKLKTWTAQQ